MNKGLFQLESFDEMKEDDLLQMNLNEGSEEFSVKCPSSNPTVDFDKDATSGSEHTVPVPGGDKETPTAKPVEGANVAVPGGDKETPAAKPSDAAAVPVPATVTLTADEYNSAIGALKKSFKEAVDICAILESASVVHKTTEEMQEEFVEAAIGDAILQSYEDGPLFEKVSRSDKNDVKKIVRKIRSGVARACKNDNVHFYQPNLVARILVGGITSPVGGASHLAAGLTQIFSTRLWQVLGICHAEDGNIKTICDNLTQKFADDLGDYKVLYVKAPMTIFDVFKTHFGWKDNRGAFFLLVDTKIPSEIRAAAKEINDQLTKSKSEGSKDGEKE